MQLRDGGACYVVLGERRLFPRFPHRRRKYPLRALRRCRATLDGAPNIHGRYRQHREGQRLRISQSGMESHRARLHFKQHLDERRERDVLDEGQRHDAHQPDAHGGGYQYGTQHVPLRAEPGRFANVSLASPLLRLEDHAGRRARTRLPSVYQGRQGGTVRRGERVDILPAGRRTRLSERDA